MFHQLNQLVQFSFELLRRVLNIKGLYTLDALQINNTKMSKVQMQNVCIKLHTRKDTNLPHGKTNSQNYVERTLKSGKIDSSSSAEDLVPDTF